MLVVNSSFGKTVPGLFELAGRDLRRFGAISARHKTGGCGLLTKYYTFSVPEETDQKLLRAAVRRTLQHRRFGLVDEAKILDEIKTGFYNQ